MTPERALTRTSPRVFDTVTLPDADETRTSLPMSEADTDPLAVERWALGSIFSTRMAPEAGWTFTGPRTPLNVCAPHATVASTSASNGTWLAAAIVMLGN